MKLELKHLEPYLSHELKCKIHRVNLRKGKEIQVLKGLVNKDACIFDYNNYFYDEIKPIFKPLSDLTAEELSILFGYEENDIVEFEIRINSIFTEDWYIQYNLFGAEGLTLIAGYSQIQQLFKEHYDLFNLIPEGLAFNINDLP